MVIGIGKLRVAALLDNGIIYGSIQHNLRGARITATATTTRRNIYSSYLRAALVGKGKADAALVIANLGAHAEHRIGFNLVQLTCYGRVLHGVGAVSIERLIDLHLVDGDVDIARCVWILNLPIYGDSLYGTSTSEILPACLRIPTVNVGTDKLLGLPLALRYLIGYGATLGTQFLLDGNNGGGKGVESVRKRICFSDIDCVTATAAAKLDNSSLFGVPYIADRPKQIDSILVNHGVGIVAEELGRLIPEHIVSTAT